MSSTTPPSPVMDDSEYSKFAQERSHSDAKGLAEFGKTLVQMMIGINGLAATGLITLAAATKETAIYTFRPFSHAIVCFLLGVSFGILATACLYASAQYWTMRWEQAAYPNMTLAMTYRRRGLRFHWGAIIASFLGLLAFVVGGYLAVGALREPATLPVMIDGKPPEPKAGQKLTCTVRADRVTLDCQ